MNNIENAFVSQNNRDMNKNRLISDGFAFEIICSNGKQAKTYTLGRLLPEAFKEI